MQYVVNILQKPMEFFNSVISFPSSHLSNADNHKKGEKSPSSFSVVTTSSHSSIQQLDPVIPCIPHQATLNQCFCSQICPWQLKLE